MKSSAVSAFYLDEKEFANAKTLEAANNIWLPGNIKPASDFFICYSGYSQDNMLAMSELMKDSISKGKKAYIYEFNVLSERQNVYVRHSEAKTIDAIDLTRCDKAILEDLYLAAMAEKINFGDVETMRGENKMLDKASFFNAIVENPEILKAGKAHGILKNCKYYRITYVTGGREYALLFIMDKEAIEVNKHNCCNVTIKLTKRVLVEFPMFN